MKIVIINGPNLNLLGNREPEIYGRKNFIEYLNELRTEYNNIDIEYFQSNIEGEIIDKLQNVGFNSDGIILNAGGYTHTSVAIADTVAAINAPVIEVHISNIVSREDFRHKSYISPVAAGVIMGFGINGYGLAIEAIKKMIL